MKEPEALDRLLELTEGQMNLTEQMALLNMLRGYAMEGDHHYEEDALRAEYTGAVDYLWMAKKITLTTKLELLQLLDQIDEEMRR